MNLDQLRDGAPTAVTVAPASGRWGRPLRQGAEVRLTFDEDGTDVQLAWEAADGRYVERVEAIDDESARRLAGWRETGPVRLAWVADEVVGESLAARIQVHVFHASHSFPEPVVLIVDERIRDRLQRVRRRSLSSAEACSWLAEQVLMPGSAPGHRRAVAIGAPEQGGRFRLLGRSIAVDVLPGKGPLTVDTVVSLRRSSRAQGFKPQEFLIEAPLEFRDVTAAGEARTAIQDQIRALVQQPGSYLNLWLEYQKIERDNLSQRARRVGWLHYDGFEALPTGAWRFLIRDTAALGAFARRVEADGRPDLECAEDVPGELRRVQDEASDALAPADDAGRRAPAPVGSLDRADHRTGVLLLWPVEEENDALPPRRGYLFPALRGDRARLERREQAVQRITSADANMPKLVHLLQGGKVQARRVDRTRPLSEAARRAFGREPTPKQRAALDQALNTPDVALIQGPPGTGKTQVIAALQARLAELDGDRPELAGRTLVTSFQHDAVDHVVSRSRVLGLPPVRFGGRPGEHPERVQVERWRVELREHLSSQLATLGEPRPLQDYRRALDGCARYAAGRLPPAELKALLEELCALEPGALLSDVWQRLDDARQGPRARSTKGSYERELQRRAASGLRVVPAAFEDDGPRAAHNVLSRCGPLLRGEERALLERAAAREPGAGFAELDALAKLRDGLLDRLLAPVLREDRQAIDPHVLEALQDAVGCLEDRARRSEGGVADALAELRDTIDQDPEGMREMLQRYSSSWAATCQQAVGGALRRASGHFFGTASFETVIVDEAARANPLDLFIPMSLARRRIVLVGDHRQLPHLLDPDVERTLNLVDPDGKSTLRDEERDALRRSLFERLFEELRKRELEDGIARVITLDQQFRMHPTLGRFVSDAFYAPHEEGFSSPRPASDFAHRLPGYLRGELPLCAVWKDVPRSLGGEESLETSKCRQPEAAWIAQEVRRLLEASNESLSIGVISFYAAQVEVLLAEMARHELASRNPDTGELEVATRWRTLEREGRREDRLRVGTVDAFQGQEFDVVFLSVVRSNGLRATTEIERRHKFGHLMVENRLCVAMSRQRRLLIAVGDRAMFDDPAAEVAVRGLTQFLKVCRGDHGDVT
jgi:hypothetical protein